MSSEFIVFEIRFLNPRRQARQGSFVGPRPLRTCRMILEPVEGCGRESRKTLSSERFRNFQLDDKVPPLASPDLVHWGEPVMPVPRGNEDRPRTQRHAIHQLGTLEVTGNGAGDRPSGRGLICQKRL